MSMATPGMSNRSKKPLSMAGAPKHQVGNWATSSLGVSQPLNITLEPRLIARRVEIVSTLVDSEHGLKRFGIEIEKVSCVTFLFEDGEGRLADSGVKRVWQGWQ